MLVDYHLHTARCGHASGTLEEYLAVARQVGLREIGFADHIPMYWLPPQERDPQTAMPANELKSYINEVKLLQGQTSDIKIKLGLEVDYIPGEEKMAAEIINSLPLDYVLGSVHYLDGWGFDNPAYLDHYQHWDTMELYQRYFQQVCQAAASGLFDVMAHPDLIKKFNYYPEATLDPLYHRVAQSFAKSGVCAEINTAGLRVPTQELYPAPPLLQWFYRFNVPVTLGSDAHTPQQVGQDLLSAVALLKQVGYKQLATFDQRKIKYITI